MITRVLFLAAADQEETVPPGKDAGFSLHGIGIAAAQPRPRLSRESLRRSLRDAAGTLAGQEGELPGGRDRR